MLTDHGRFSYSGIAKRESFEWPGGKHIALYIALNIEHFPYGEGGGIDLDRETKPWSQRSWLWREYGNRVGGWRLADLFDELEMNLVKSHASSARFIKEVYNYIILNKDTR